MGNGEGAPRRPQEGGGPVAAVALASAPGSPLAKTVSPAFWGQTAHPQVPHLSAERKTYSRRDDKGGRPGVGRGGGVPSRGGPEPWRHGRPTRGDSTPNKPLPGEGAAARVCHRGRRHKGRADKVTRQRRKNFRVTL